MAAMKLDKNDFEGAIADFSIAIQNSDDDESDYYAQRAYSFEMISDYYSAIADYTNVIRISPDNANAYCDRGRNKNFAGEFENAIPDFDKAISLDPLMFRSFVSRASARCRIDHVSAALADLNRAISLNPDCDKKFYVFRDRVRAARHR